MKVKRWGGLYGFVWWMFALVCVLAVAVVALSYSNVANGRAVRASTHANDASTRAAQVASCVNQALATRQQSSVDSTRSAIAYNEALLAFLSRVYTLGTRTPTDPAAREKLLAQYRHDFQDYLAQGRHIVELQRHVLALQESAPLGSC